MTLLYKSDSWKTPERAAEEYRSNKKVLWRVKQGQGNHGSSDPWLADIFKRIGYCKLKLEDKDGAQSSYKTAALIAPSDPDSHLWHGYALYALKRNQEAIAEYKWAISLPNPSPDVYGYLGGTYGEINEWLLARDAYRLWIEKDPKNPEARIALAIAESRMNHFDSSEEILQKAATDFPGNSSVQQYLTYVQQVRRGGR